MSATLFSCSTTSTSERKLMLTAEKKEEEEEVIDTHVGRESPDLKKFPIKKNRKKKKKEKF